MTGGDSRRGKATIHVIILGHADLAVFREMARKGGVEIRTHRLRHHPAWLASRSTARNARWWVGQVARILPYLLAGRLVVFGSALVRLFWPVLSWRSGVVWVFNELPDLSGPSSLLRRYDRFLLMRVRQLYVSSVERAAYVERHVGREATGILPNVPDLEEKPRWDASEQDRREAVIYAGTITRRRFPDAVMETLGGLHLPVDLFGWAAEDCGWARFENVNYAGTRTPEELASQYSRYRYGLLSYPTSDANNDLCAPIKIYEYVYYGCVCLSVFRNQGLERWFAAYPSLVVTLAEWRHGGVSAAAAHEQREAFLLEAERAVSSAASSILNALGYRGSAGGSGGRSQFG